MHTPKASIESKSSRLNPWDGIGEVKPNRLKRVVLRFTPSAIIDIFPMENVDFLFVVI